MNRASLTALGEITQITGFTLRTGQNAATARCNRAGFPPKGDALKALGAERDRSFGFLTGPACAHPAALSPVALWPLPRFSPRSAATAPRTDGRHRGRFHHHPPPRSAEKR